MRSFWKGAVSFGLVSIPVRLYVAAATKDPALHYIHKEDSAPVRYQKVCSECGSVLEKDDIVLGYEFKPGSYVAVPEDELQGLEEGVDAHTLKILSFIPKGSLDPVFFAKAYYVEPGDGGKRPYVLLRKAMEESGRVALCRVRLRSRSALALIRLNESGALMMQTLFDPDEIRDASDLDLPEETVAEERELTLALTLVDALAGPFEPTEVPDTYRKELEELLSRKAMAATTAPREAAKGRVVDLMEALQASINRAREVEGPVPADAGADGARAVR